MPSTLSGFWAVQYISISLDLLVNKVNSVEALLVILL